ncbi:UPF0149 family protein [Paraburkholderia fungorum]|uniref:UPF0149 family protein n=1 Tax=Paraburkholderia fungorum TaxID=134537 RepID=UPI0038BA8C4E
MTPLSDEELDELAEFLVSDQVSDDSFMIVGLDGYLTAIAIGPTTLALSDWLPRVWGPSEDHAPEFESDAQAQRILELMLRHLNDILWRFEFDEDGFEPLFDIVDFPDGPVGFAESDEWVMGFMHGIALCRQDWQPLFDSEQGQEWLRPLRLLNDDDLTAEEQAISRIPAERDVLTKQIPVSIAEIHHFWLPYRQAAHDRKLATTIQRTEPKIGRNDPCPCGSGKKFKKCCGAAATLH